MRTRYLVGLMAVLLLILAIWLVPMTLAAAGDPAGSPDPYGSTPSTETGTQCPFLQAHPWLDPHGSDDSAVGPGDTSGASTEVFYY